jgi:hypothetical protein
LATALPNNLIALSGRFITALRIAPGFGVLDIENGIA